VQIAGHKVSLPYTSATLKAAFPNLIKEVWLRKMNISEGRRLKAGLQLKDFASLKKEDKAEIYHWIEENLVLEARPKHLTFSADKALNSAGKLIDWPINE